MVFSSIPFLYFFLPAVFLCYLIAPKRFKNSVLLAFSLLAAGGCVCAVGIGTMPSAFPSGLLCLGAGLVVLSFGLGFLALSFLFYGRFLPWLFGSLADAAGGMRRGCRKEAGA